MATLTDTPSYTPLSAPPSAPVAEGNTWRGIGSSMFNANAIAKEDFQRDLQLAEYTNKYNQYLSDTQYQRAVSDMKKAGINPILAYAQGGNSASAPAVSSSRSAGSAAADSALLKMLGGIISTAIESGVKMTEIYANSAKHLIGFGG